MKKVLPLTFFLIFVSTQAESEIIGNKYFGRDLERLFMSVSGWKNEFIFREQRNAQLPTFRDFNEMWEFECVKGVDASLSAQANLHAEVKIRFCDKSLVEQKLFEMDSNLKTFQELEISDPLLAQLIKLSNISRSQTNLNGEIHTTYQIRFFGIGHGIGVGNLTITTSKNSELAVISWILFANEERNCLADVLCKFDEEMMAMFNQKVLLNEERFLTPHLNEFKSHLAFPMIMNQWEQMGTLRELVKESRSFEAAREKYPEIDIDMALQSSDFAGQLNKQKDGSYRMYLILLIQFGGVNLGEGELKDARNIVMNTFDKFLTNHLNAILENN